MIGAVPATWMWRPSTTAREYPQRSSKLEPDEMSRRAMRLVSPAVEALRQVDAWPAAHAAVAVVGPGGVLASRGEPGREFRWASVTKLLTATAALVALEEGIVDLDDPAGPPGSTLRHLLSHAAGLPLNEGPPIANPGQRRIYSNSGIEAAAATISAAAAMPFAEYLRAAVTGPLELSSHLEGSAAWGYSLRKRSSSKPARRGWC